MKDIREIRNLFDASFASYANNAVKGGSDVWKTMQPLLSPILIGIRDRANDRFRDSDKFVDTLVLGLRERVDIKGGAPVFVIKDVYEVYERFTTTPGLFSYQNGFGGDPVSMLVPGYYPAFYTPGKHYNQDAFVQQGSPAVVTSSRLNELPSQHLARFDDELSKRKLTTRIRIGWYGINCHSYQLVQNFVGKGSAGCQVLADPSDLASVRKKVLEMIREKYGSKLGDRFFLDYFLIDTKFTKNRDLALASSELRVFNKTG